MPPGKDDLSIRRGDSFRRGYVLYADEEQTVPFDLTGYTVCSQIRAATESTEVMATFTEQITLPNSLTITLTAAETALLKPGNWVWDLEITDSGGWVTTILAGSAVVTADVSRDCV